MSRIEENLIKQAKRMGHVIPERVKNKPILLAGLSLYLDAFFQLQFDGNESGFIPWTAIIKYAEYYGFSEEQTERLIFFVRELNEVHSKWLSKKKGK